MVNGVSTRDGAKDTEQWCGPSFSKSTVSDLCKRLDPIVQAWNPRSLAEHRYPFLLVDALVLRIREDGRIRSRAALIAVGVNDEGHREMLGLMLESSESESSWRAFFAWLKQRGLSGVDIVVSDRHGGLVKAL
ncbi:MAG: DNA polymerase IV [Hydrogenibacillus schlegelii]|uniref:Mutator family transposase n=2 Tax=Hydrogenibacillus schlegelii TaxID=1484 RepID=A0A2T5G4T8_HYDSH|nr:MAG: DNA polymerase IV [Hydrogenibacillus schlegelii]